MRPRTRRLKSLLVGIVFRPLVEPRAGRPPAATPRGDAKVSAMRIRGSAPLCLTGALAGGGPKRLGVDRRPCVHDAIGRRGAQDGRAALAGGGRAAARPIDWRGLRKSTLDSGPHDRDPRFRSAVLRSPPW